MYKLFENCPHIFWINLDKSTLRFNHMQSQFNKFQIENSTRVCAYDGDFLESFLSYGSIEHLKKTRIVSARESACACSHLKALKMFLDSKYDDCLIFEDDICFDLCQYWKLSLSEYIKQSPIEKNLLILAPNSLYIEDTNYAKFLYNFHHGAGVYYLTRKIAEKIISSVKITKDKNHKYNLEQCSRFDIIADKMIYRPVALNSFILPLFTYLNYDSILHPSHLNNHKKVKQKIVKLWSTVK